MCVPLCNIVNRFSVAPCQSRGRDHNGARLEIEVQLLRGNPGQDFLLHKPPQFRFDPLNIGGSGDVSEAPTREAITKYGVERAGGDAKKEGRLE